MLRRFVPTERELFEYWKWKTNAKPPYVGYKSWLYNNLRDLLSFCFDAGFELVVLRHKSKVPMDIESEPSEWKATGRFIRPVILDIAYEYLDKSSEVEKGSYGNFGIRAGQEMVLLDYDSVELTPELEWLAAQTLTIVTPRGYSFFTLEPLDDKLWRQIVGVPSEPGLGIPGFTNLGSARRGYSYVCAPGSVTCVNQTGNTKNHTEWNQPCNNSENGMHNFKYRFFYSPIGYYLSFVPLNPQILPFEYFVRVAMKELPIAKK